MIFNRGKKPDSKYQEKYFRSKTKPTFSWASLPHSNHCSFAFTYNTMHFPACCLLQQPALSCLHDARAWERSVAKWEEMPLSAFSVTLHQCTKIIYYLSMKVLQTFLEKQLSGLSYSPLYLRRIWPHTARPKDKPMQYSVSSSFFDDQGLLGFCVFLLLFLLGQAGHSF